jgi:signal transduction histidine kinase
LSALRWWRRLHVRAALLSLPLLLLLGTAMVLLLQRYSAQAALEAGQRMNLGLARYVIEHQSGSLLGADGRPDAARMKALAEHVMQINPAVEVYLLDDRARVIGHALDLAAPDAVDPVGREVDMAPMRDLLAVTSGDEARVRLPVFGTDPRSPARMNTFTVAPVVGPGGRMGYLYIVLHGRTARDISANLANSEALRAMALGAALATALAAAVLAWVWLHLTRPLRRLADEVRGFRVEDGLPDGAGGGIAAAIEVERATAAGAAEPARIERGDEITLLRRTVAAMRSRIQQQFRRLEDSDRQRRELMSNISHDLRTPLSSMQGYVETVLVGGGTLDAAAREQHLRTALRHADILGRRIGDLFELSKLDAGRVLPRQERFCLAELLQDVVQNYRLAAQQRGVALRLAAGSHAQAHVLADIAMIERVLQNLIDNALRSTADGGHIELAIENRGAWLQISVSDTGRGISTQQLPHIFERYWRAEEPPDAAAGDAAAAHSGLGLAIVKRILDLHGSAVRVHSELHRGTRFEFSLPQAA